MRAGYLILLILGPLLVRAQTETGDWLMGGQLSFNTTDALHEFTFSPQLGCFIVRNLAVGGSLSTSIRKIGELRTVSWDVGPTVRYYFGSRNYRPILTARAGFLSEKQSGLKAEKGWTYGVGAGLAAFLNEHVALEFIAEYNGNKLRDRKASDGFHFRAGFQVYMDRYRMRWLTGGR